MLNQTDGIYCIHTLIYENKKKVYKPSPFLFPELQIDHRRNTDIVRGENIETSLITILQKLPKWRSSQRAVGTEEKDGGRAKGGPAQAYEPKDRVVFKPDLERWPSHGHLAVLEREGLRNRK